MGFTFGFGMFNIMFFVIFAVFVLVIFLFAAAVVKEVRQWNRNNHSPRLTVPASVVAKRISVNRHNHSQADDFHHHTVTSYYVTFQVESGDRMELHVTGNEYGMLIEGDCGQLTFQGTRYLGFERTVNQN